MSNTYSGWHVLYVKFQHEKKIESLLKDLELDSFVPTITTVRQWADRKKKVVQPLFPTYIFLNVHSKNEFYKALHVDGVFRYVRFGEKYAKLRSIEIDRIKCFLNLEGLSEIDTSSYFPSKGELMTINYGPLKGLECKVIRANSKHKIFVSIESLRKNIVATIPYYYLSPR